MYLSAIIGFCLILLLLAVGIGFAVYGGICLMRRRRAPMADAAESPRATETLPQGLPGAPMEAGHPAPQTTSTKTTTKHFSSFKEQGASFMNSLFLRSLVIAGITIGLLIPLVLVSNLVDERAALQREAVRDIASQWGGTQTVSGPALVIPYVVREIREETVRDLQGKPMLDALGKPVVTRQEFQVRLTKIVLPSRLDIVAKLAPETRYWGIYHYVVYKSPVILKGSVTLPGLAAFGDNLIRVEWHKASFALGIHDLKAIAKVDSLLWNDKPCPPFNPGTHAGDLLGPGFHTDLPFAQGAAPQGEQTFALQLTLNGSGGLYFTTVGETTNITISGAWPHPNFRGGLLPTTRSITDKDFTANWSVPHLSRSYPQVGDLEDRAFGLDGSERSAVRRFTVGAGLYEAVSLYTQTDRAVKYGILFIGLTFIALLCFELASRARLHFMQYGLVGVAMTLFYLVLLSLAEHAPFALAFGAASLVSIAMNSLYIAAALKSALKGLCIAALLAGLYAVLYALLQMEDYALLVGSGLVVLVVSVLMFLTRNLPVKGGAQEGQ